MRRPGLTLVSLGLAALLAAQRQALDAFLGGQGTINVNSWSPDSTRFAYTSYRLLEP